MYERNLEYNNKVYVSYVVYEKAFDRVDWTKLMTILQNIGVDWRYWQRGKARMFTISIVMPPPP